MPDYVIYDEIPHQLADEVGSIEELNSEGGAFRCLCCGHACAFDRLTPNFEIYACINCNWELKVS